MWAGFLSSYTPERDLGRKMCSYWTCRISAGTAAGLEWEAVTFKCQCRPLCHRTIIPTGDWKASTHTPWCKIISNVLSKIWNCGQKKVPVPCRRMRVPKVEGTANNSGWSLLRQEIHCFHGPWKENMPDRLDSDNLTFLSGHSTQNLGEIRLQGYCFVPLADDTKPSLGAWTGWNALPFSSLLSSSMLPYWEWQRFTAHSLSCLKVPRT